MIVMRYICIFAQIVALLLVMSTGYEGIWLRDYPQGCFDLLLALFMSYSADRTWATLK